MLKHNLLPVHLRFFLLSLRHSLNLNAFPGPLSRTRFRLYFTVFNILLVCILGNVLRICQFLIYFFKYHMSYCFLCNLHVVQ